jgi:hypothetical protein
LLSTINQGKLIWARSLILTIFGIFLYNTSMADRQELEEGFEPLTVQINRDIVSGTLNL